MAVGRQAATVITDSLRANPKAGVTFATGSTPLETYNELARLSCAGILDCSRATGFHLDEYVGLPNDHSETYQHYLQEHVFQHLHFGAVHFLNGCVGNLEEECHRYDRLLQTIGVDVLIAGIGANAHLAFNEPPADPDRTTHIEHLSEQTRRDNARFFGGRIDQVPQQAITQGLRNILDARQIVLLATGGGKAEAVRRAVEESVTRACPASFLQHHPNVTIILDKAAAAKLTERTPHVEYLHLDTPVVASATAS